MQAKNARKARNLLNAVALTTALFAALALAGSASAVAGTDVAIATPDISFSNPSPVDGSQVSVLVTVHNLGDQNATDVVVTATVTSSNEVIGTAVISFLAAQSQLETAILWNISGEGLMTVTVSVTAAEADVQPANNNALSEAILVRARPDLKVDAVTFDNPAPPDGTVAVGIFVTISNVGGSDASIVHLTLYDGPPSDMRAIYNTTILSGVALDSPQLITYFWSLDQQGGRHDIYAVVDSSTPAERADAQGNNWASGRVLVLTWRDYEVSTERAVSFDPLWDGFVIIHSGGSLSLTNSTFTLLQERANQFDVIVESGGELILTNAHLASDFPFGITIRAGGSVELRAGSSVGGSITSEGGGLWLYNTTVNGDLTGSFQPLWVEDSLVNGALTLSASQATLRRTQVSTPTNIHVDGTVLSVEWLTLLSGADPALALTGGSTAGFAGIDAGAIFVESGCSASVWRLAEFSVTDLTGMPVPGAKVESRFSLNSSVVSMVTTGMTGLASAWLVSDLLDGGSPQYVGSYLHSASFTTYHTSVVVNMAYYPTLTGESNRQPVELTFDVINPADIFRPTVGDRTFSGATAVNDFNQTGNIFVRGVVTLDGVLTVWQSRDFETAIVVHSGQVVIGASGGIRSNRALNIYLYNASELTASGGSLEANAVVTFNTARVSLANGTSVPRGSIILMGSSFTLGQDAVASATRLYARAGTSVVLSGATASFAVVDVRTTGDIQITNTTLTSFTDLTLRTTGSNKSLKTSGASLICGIGGEAAFEASFIDMKETTVSGCGMALFSASSVQARDTIFSSTLTGFRPGSAATFYDVSYPSLVVDPSAIVTTFHRLTINAIDINLNAVTEGDYTIVAVPGGQDAGRGGLAATIAKDLEASRIALGFETFTGNYRVTVAPSAGGAAPIVRDLVMDGARAEVFFFAQEIVKPNSLQVDATVEPSKVLHGGAVSISGGVSIWYPNRLTPLFRAGMDVKIDDGAGFSVIATTDSTGAFNWTGAFAPVSTAPGVRQVSVSASYNDATGGRGLTVEVLKPAPVGLVVILDSESLRFEPNVGQAFIIRGQVFYIDSTGARGDPVNNARVQASFINPPQPDSPGASHSDSNGYFNLTVGGRNTPKSYQLNVVAFDEAIAKASDPQLVSALVGARPVGGPVGSSLTLWILLGAGAAVGVGVVALVVNAKRKSVNYVECGNCGRPAHEGDKKCPSCGCEFEEDIAKCSHCASWIPANAVRCPKCNTEFKPVGEAMEAPEVAPDKAAPEGVKAEVTTVAEPVKAPVVVKKKVLKTAEPAGQPPKGDGPKFENPWDKPGEKPTQPIQPGEDQPKPAEKKPDEKKEKGLFDDL